MCKKLILSIIAMLTLALPSMGQEVAKSDTAKYILQGNVFKSNDSVSNSKAEEKKTKYNYEDKKGQVYPVYLSKTGKAFIWRKSQKTGRDYRQYVPEIGKIINPKAYEDKAPIKR